MRFFRLSGFPDLVIFPTKNPKKNFEISPKKKILKKFSKKKRFSKKIPKIFLSTIMTSKSLFHVFSPQTRFELRKKYEAKYYMKFEKSQIKISGVSRFFRVDNSKRLLLEFFFVFKGLRRFVNPFCLWQLERKWVFL